MARQPPSKGRCNYCGQDYAKSGMTRHLQGCASRREALAAPPPESGVEEMLFHLVLQDRCLPDFWLHLEMRGSAVLGNLDAYLRAIWLECCGHMSDFRRPGDYEELSMDEPVIDWFEPGLELMHVYDYGTSSETLVKVQAERKGRPTTPNPIALMARNLQPEVECIQCGAPAAFLCMECLNEDQTSGMLCAAHAKRHPHREYGRPIPLVNSPRLGLCGYTGPADPPY